MRVCCVLLWIALSSALGAIELKAPDEIESDAKALISLPVTVTTTKEMDVLLQVLVPDGWKLVSSAKVRNANSDGKKKLLSILVSKTASSDTPYVIEVKAKDASVKTHVTIRKQENVEIHGSLSETVYFAKEIIEGRITVKNSGNTRTHCSLSAESNMGWKVSIKKKLELAPGEIVELPFTIKTEDLPSPAYHIVTIRLGENLPSLRLGAEVLPRRPKDQGLLARIPADLEIKASSITWESHPQLEWKLRAGGPLGGTYRSDLLASGVFFSEQGGTSTERYRLYLKNKHGWDVTLGESRADFPQIIQDLFGDGIRVRVSRGDSKGKIYYGKERKATEDALEKAAFGLSLDHDIDKETRVGLTYININEEPTSTDSAPVDSWMMTGHLQKKFPCNLRIQADTGFGEETEELERKKAFAGKVHINGLYKTLSYNGEVYHSDPHFPGTLRDRQGFRSYGSYQINPSISFWIEHLQYRGMDEVRRTTRSSAGGHLWEQGSLPSMDLSMEREHAKRDDENEILWKAAVNLFKTYSWSRVASRIQWERTKDLADPGLSHNLESLVSVDSGFGDLSLSGTGSYTLSSDRGRHFDNRQVEATASHPLGRRLHVVLKGTYLWQRFDGGGGSSTRTLEPGLYFSYLSIHGDLRYRDKLLTGDSGAIDGRNQNRQLRFRLTYTPSSRCTLSSEMEANENESRERYFRGQVSLRWRFGLPVPFYKKRARVKGRIHPAEGRTRLSLGQHITYSDETGAFVFPSLEPGAYCFYLDPSTLPPGYSPIKALPDEIVLKRGESYRLDIHLEPVVEIHGFVRAQDRGIAKIRIVLIQNDVEVEETFSKRDGHFRFSDLLPGSYEVAIDPAYVPENLRESLPESRPLVIDSQLEQEKILFTLYEKVRPMHIKRFGK